jgi:hypothetical protein
LFVSSTATDPAIPFAGAAHFTLLALTKVPVLADMVPNRHEAVDNKLSANTVT